jgi:uncharacterized protein involved in outer membrane biogenesis
MVILLVVAVVGIGLSLDKVIKKAVETAGPAITKVDVKLDKVDLSLFSGSGSLHGFSLGNPKGYTAPTSIEFASASLSLEPSSLMSDKVVIHHIRLDAPVITFEGGLRGNNLNDLVKGMQSGTEQKSGEESTPEEKEADEASSRKLQVDEFSLTGAKVNVSIKELGGDAKTIVLPDIKMTNLGTGPEGVTAGELTKLILKEITEKTLKAVMESGGDLNKIGESALQQLNQSGNQDTEKAVRGVLDMFKKKE